MPPAHQSETEWDALTPEEKKRQLYEKQVSLKRGVSMRNAPFPPLSYNHLCPSRQFGMLKMSHAIFRWNTLYKYIVRSKP